MARTRRFQFHLGPFRAAVLALLLIACASGSAIASGQGKTLFLLTGTCCLNDTPATFPVSLYTVNAQHKPKLFRTVVSGSVGTSGILDDMRDEIYVTYPSDTGVSSAPAKVSIIHDKRPWENDVVTFNPEVMMVWPYATVTSAGPDLNSFALFTVFPLQHSPNGHAAFMQFLRSSATTLVAVAGNPPAKGARITRNDWTLYRHLTFAGSPGGPGYYPPPQVTVESRGLVMRYGGKTVLVDQAPLALPASANGHKLRIVAASLRFVVTWYFQTSDRYAPATLYVHGRQLNTWKLIKSVGSSPVCRIFGSWLATTVRSYAGRGGAPDENPGHMHESNHWVKDLLPDVRDQFYLLDSSLRIPGVLILDNLVDGRRIRLETHEEDSEILDVRKDGLVLYRVNNEIFSAKIEGDKLSAPKQVVKGEDVPEVHWVFWSKAGREPHSTAHSSAKH